MERGLYKYAVIVLCAIVGVGCYFVIPWSSMNKSDWASWVQAVGSIAAIVGALWVASEQHRRDVIRREEEKKERAYVLDAELAWLSLDVLNFINQFINVSANQRVALSISDDDVSDLLDRLSWCRQRAQNKGQLAMIGTMRRSLMGTARIVRLRIAHPSTLFTRDDVRSIEENRSDAAKVSEAANRVEAHPQFMP